MTMLAPGPGEGQTKPWRDDARANYAKLKTALGPLGSNLSGASAQPLRQMNRGATRVMQQLGQPFTPSEGMDQNGFVQSLRDMFSQMQSRGSQSPFARMFDSMRSWRQTPSAGGQ